MAIVNWAVNWAIDWAYVVLPMSALIWGVYLAWRYSVDFDRRLKQLNVD